MTDHTDYFDYLHSRSRSYVGLLRRRPVLCLRLARHVSVRMLDVDCGIEDFLEFRPGTVGAGVNLYVVEWCRRSGPYCRLMEVDRLPYPNGGFDGMVGAFGFYCGGVFHTPMKSRWLASWLPLYWLYGIFERS